MDSVDVGRALLGRGSGSAPSGAVTQISALAASDSASGMVDVWIEGELVECACNVSVKAGQTVAVSVVNRRPTVTGVAGWGDGVAVKIGEIAAEVAYIDQAYIQELVANSVTAASIVAASAYVGLLEAGDVSADELNAAVAEIGRLDADELNAAVAKLGELDADVINAAIAKVGRLDVESIEVAVAKIGELDVDQLSAVVAKVGRLDADAIEAAVAKVGELDAGKLDADMANIDVANVSQAYVDWLSAGYARIAQGVIDNAKIRFADVQDVHIQSAMVEVAEIRDMLVKSGIIGEFVSESGKVTGVLDAVRINADTITGGTLSVDRLLLRGEGGLFYAVNATTDGVTAEQLSTDEYRNALHGDNIVASSVTADKISVSDLVAFGATIGGLVIEDGCLRSFAKSSLGSESAGFYLGRDGSFNLGGRGRIKYDAARDSLEIRASNISVDASPLVVATKDEFYSSTSPTALSGGSWSGAAPAWSAGRYVWRRMRVDYSDGSYDFEPSDKGVCITGNTGPQGSAGKDGAAGAPGKDGAPGKGVKSTAVAYQASASGTSAPTGGWSASVPSVAANQYLWTRIVLAYTDGTSTTAYSVGKMGANGANGAAGAPGTPGAAGVGVKSAAVTYQASASGTTAPTGSWSAGVPSVAANQYLWTRIVITYTDGTSSTAYSVGKMGATGATGAPGKDGAAGKPGADGADGKMLYGACNTAAATAAKVTASNIAGFSLYVGATVSIKFTYANTAASPTLNVNGTGAKQIRLNGANSAYWAAGATVALVYDGTYWQVCNTPLYGSTSTIGNPAGGNVYTDGGGIEIRSGATALARIKATLVELGCNAKTAVIKLCGGIGTMCARVGETRDVFGVNYDVNAGEPLAVDTVLGGYNASVLGSVVSAWGSVETLLGKAGKPTRIYGNAYVNGTYFYGDGDWFFTWGVAATKLCTQKSSAYPVYGGRVVYENSSGNAGTVTVSETLANFFYAEIYFGKPEGSKWVVGCSKVHSPNGKRVTLTTSQIASDGNTRQILTRSYSLSGTTIAPLAPGRYYNLNTNSYGDDGTSMKIYRVVGYR